jgi:hypothetical protein
VRSRFAHALLTAPKHGGRGWSSTGEGSGGGESVQRLVDVERVFQGPSGRQLWSS